MQNNIKAFLRMRGMTQAELAKKTGFTQATISRWVNGQRNPNIGSAYRLAKALNVSVDDLFKTWKDRVNRYE